MDATSAILSADRYDQPKAREYQELIDMIQKRGRNGENFYTDLMNKEERVLSTVDRVVNDARLQKSSEKSFLHMSIFENVMTTSNTLRAIFSDLMNTKSVSDIHKPFVKKDRLLYLGVALVVLAVSLMTLHLHIL